jgi:hypothetical protein
MDLASPSKVAITALLVGAVLAFFVTYSTYREDHEVVALFANNKPFLIIAEI